MRSGNIMKFWFILQRVEPQKYLSNYFLCAFVCVNINLTKYKRRVTKYKRRVTNTLGTRNNFLVLLSHCIAFSTRAGSNGAISTGASILIADRYVKFDIIDGRKRILFKCSWSFVNEELYNS